MNLSSILQATLIFLLVVMATVFAVIMFGWIGWISEHFPVLMSNQPSHEALKFLAVGMAEHVNKNETTLAEV